VKGALRSPTVMVKRIYFFKGGLWFEYDPRAGTDRVVKGPVPIGDRFAGLDAAFAGGIDAAVNWGDGFVYLFKGNRYWKYDALRERVDTVAPRKISEGWPTLPADFAAGIDAAFNSGSGRAYFFKGDRYVRYDVENDRVDAPDPGTSPYPRRIADANGWRGLSAAFHTGIDAAVNSGDGKVYFFKGGEYARLSFASRSVDVVTPPYPRSIATAWPGLPPEVDAAVEWVQAGTATLDITLHPTCQHLPAADLLSASLGRTFVMAAKFASDGYPSLCGCAEYRQFVRGSFKINGVVKEHPLPNPSGGPPLFLLPRPPPGSADDGFREDGNSGPATAYGHRNAAPDKFGAYRPEQRTGCRYDGIDSPVLLGKVGDRVEIELDFRGQIIDVAAGAEVIVEKTWSVSCSGVL
jgi:hypothetical protein